MQKLRSGFGLFAVVLALCGGVTSGQTVRSDAKASVSQAEREFDPDAGTESPIDEGAFEGEVAGAADGCESIGAFTTVFTFPARYRGNLYRIADSGVFLKEIQMKLAFAGVADLFVSVHRKLPNNTYEEVDISPSSPNQGFVFVSGALGLGANVPAFYSSGLLNDEVGIELTPGDYAIGFAWGPESIKYGRDTGVLYPRPFEVGSTLASVSRELSGTEPPLNATLSGLSLFTGGAYAQELCFVPARGACCQYSTQICVSLFEEECVGQGSFFHGQRTLCAETPCNFGACCFDCGLQVGFPAQCEDGYAPERCLQAGGVAHWPGVTCPTIPQGGDAALCPKVTGACCNGVTCTLQCEAECLNNQGTYRGDGTDCEPNFCKGACCSVSIGRCFNTTQINCTTGGGAFKGAGTLCETLPPNQECGGACCSGNDTLTSCSNVVRRDLCAPDGSGFPPKIVYRGDNTACLSQTCGVIADYTACCLPNGTCLNSTLAGCTSDTVQGTPISGLCEDAPGQCLSRVALCCFNDGSCQALTVNSCVERGGDSVPGQSICTETACVSFGGACCGGALGDCTLTTEAVCNAQGGVYRGDDSTCQNASTVCPGLGGCCKSNGDCFDALSNTECQTIGGFYEGNGVFCAAPQVDCDERGACCTQTGSCLFVDEAACIEINGEFKGVGFSCAGNVCKGGCCQGATCSVKTEEQCLGVEGVYFGDGSGCTANACSTGACCRAVGTCQNEVQGGFCSGTGEAFTPAALCADVSCVARGACCTGQNCTVTTQAACQGVYRGNGVLCTQETCAATGACCNGTSCSPATQTACTTGGGVYKGDNVACGANTCPVTGACCNGATCLPKTQADCLSGGGEYKGDNSVCGANTCPAIPTGACCNGTTCSTATQTACTTGGGVYRGDNSVCGANTCPVTGACCNGATCLPKTQAGCLSGGGEYKGDGSLCEANTCQVAPLCTAITGTNPANCSIDARRPHPPNTPATPEGWNLIDLTFDCDTTNHTTADYSVSVTPSGTVPTVLSVTPLDATRVRLDLSGPIPPGAWTCITYTPAGLTRCLGFLPGDVNASRGTAPSDILNLINNLNGVEVPPLVIAQCDLDRSGGCAPADILTLIDLLNGTNGFVTWNGQTLPVCPAP